MQFSTKLPSLGGWKRLARAALGFALQVGRTGPGCAASYKVRGCRGAMGLLSTHPFSDPGAPAAVARGGEEKTFFCLVFFSSYAPLGLFSFDYDFFAGRVSGVLGNLDSICCLLWLFLPCFCFQHQFCCREPFCPCPYGQAPFHSAY